MLMKSERIIFGISYPIFIGIIFILNLILYIYVSKNKNLTFNNFSTNYQILFYTNYAYIVFLFCIIFILPQTYMYLSYITIGLMLIYLIYVAITGAIIMTSKLNSTIVKNLIKSY